MENVKYNIETGEKLIRDTRNITITYQGHSKTFSMPGWYPENSDEGTFTQEDMKAYDRTLNQLKAEAENLLLPADIRSIRKKLKFTQMQA